MSYRLRYLSIALAAISCTTTFAASKANTTQEMQSLSRKAAVLEKQMQSLQTEIASLKATQKKLTEQNKAALVSAKKEKQTAKTEYEANKHALFKGPTVTTTPTLGVRAQYNGADLITNVSRINTDVAVLQERQAFGKRLQKEGLPTDAYDPRLDISGQLEGMANYTNTYSGGNTSDIDFSGAELDLVAEVSQWVTGYFDIAYDNTDTDNGDVPREYGSKLYLDRGFINIGNLNETPLYFTVGQIFVPFGQYTSYMFSSTLPKMLGRTKARPFLVGLQFGGVNLSAYIFRSDTEIARTTSSSGANRVKGLGLNASQTFNWGDNNFTYGISYINNIADANGMQDNGASGGFRGFGRGSSQNNHLVHKVPGVDGRVQLGLGHWTLLGEYTGAERQFSKSNMTFNSHGARPWAGHLEVDYGFNMGSKPSTVLLAYGQTGQALALNLPRKRYTAAFITSLWRSTLETLEFRHEIGYNRSDSATGQGNTLDGDITNTQGKSTNIVSAVIDVYF